jgi:hypothetical protein
VEIIYDIFKFFDDHAQLMAAIATFITAIVALYLGSWRDKLRSPKLKICFKEVKRPPYFKVIPFDPYDKHIYEFRDSLICFFKPGFNALVKILNVGKATARRVSVKIEKIEFISKKPDNNSERFYHPSTVKWSGEKGWDSVDIIPGSHYFLDTFYSINETKYEIKKLNKAIYFDAIGDQMMQEIINEINPSEEIYWNVWVDKSYARGIPQCYTIEGDFVLHFILNAENHKPIRFRAFIRWSKASWKMPDMKIEVGKKYINSDKGHGYNG